VAHTVCVTQPSAIFAGTFDPVTKGHVDIVHRAAAVFARVIVSVSRGGRSTVFDVNERVAMFERAIEGVENVSIEPFEGLVIEQARRHEARVLLRGIREVGDWDYEMQMAFANRDMAPEVETVFLAPSSGLARVSASLVREVASLGGSVASWVPAHVAEALRAKFPRT